METETSTSEKIFHFKVKNFQRNYLESEKFFSKFSYFLERENFPKPKSEKIFKI